MTRRQDMSHRLDRSRAPSLRSWSKPTKPAADAMAANVAIKMGWGRLIFGHTYDSLNDLVDTIMGERPGRRDITLYLRDPHVLLSLAPQELFLDPSHTYRLWSQRYRASKVKGSEFVVRRLATRHDAEEVNRIYEARNMVPSDVDFMLDENASMLRTYLVAVATADNTVIGTVTGVDHVEAFNDPENGSSLWCLAVDPRSALPGVGETLVRRLVEHYFARGRDFVDLSVMHDNKEAIRLYDKLKFERVPVFCVKRKNPINEALFTGPKLNRDLNPYARIITDEARRRGIGVEVIDEEFGHFRLAHGGRSVVCRESLTELTSSIGFLRCDDKRLTHRVLKSAGLHVPDQQPAGDTERDLAFLRKHGSVVIKPARGEQGAGVSVDLEMPEELTGAVERARAVCDDVVIEECVDGQDLRIIVIGSEMVAAAVRKPAQVTGTGKHTIRQLIEKYNRRRLAATGGESKVPLDSETQRCVNAKGYGFDDTLPSGNTLEVRRTANLHTGGTIHDCTDQVHPALEKAAVAAAQALAVPVVGLDLSVREVGGPNYAIIEANERPGLANHEPQPTAEKFINLLFPTTSSMAQATTSVEGKQE
jgi:GNAT-family acetyltransferase (TIGR03103 family)